MAIGLAGDTASVTDGAQTAQLLLIEMRVQNELLQAQMGNGFQEELHTLRDDVAFDLGITPNPVPGD